MNRPDIDAIWKELDATGEGDLEPWAVTNITFPVAKVLAKAISTERILLVYIAELERERDEAKAKHDHNLAKRKHTAQRIRSLRNLNFERIAEFCEKRLCVFSDARYEKNLHLQPECREWKYKCDHLLAANRLLLRRARQMVGVIPHFANAEECDDRVAGWQRELEHFPLTTVEVERVKDLEQRVERLRKVLEWLRGRFGWGISDGLAHHYHRAIAKLLAGATWEVAMRIEGDDDALSESEGGRE